MKILSLVLDATPFIARFRLAACAYRKELTNLEKWLNENLTLFKDDFFEECVMFLKEILSDVKNDVPYNTPESPISLINVYEETCPTFFKVLQTYSGQLTSRELFNEFKRLHDLSSSKFQRSVPEDISTSNGSRDEIEAEANAYFHQMFSGPLTVDAMVQMLARFKESSEKREQLIFDCMIANLFEEYKFFPKYPDKQLKLAAVLFGSLIKNQLVTHLALGIALRGVLDALRKSADSKMFMFGSKALEQFIDRLVEWPQYCNHILQISHLRCSHAELVSLIERALAKIPSSQTEINGGNSLPADQQQGSSQPSVESMELSETSWQCMSSTSFSQLGQQLSPFQLQQKHQSFLGDQLKQSVISISNTNALQSNGGPSSQSSFQVPPSQHSAGVPATVSSSPGFLCPSLDITPAGMLRQPSHSMGFGAALNIETLVAAAERRDTPTEVPGSEVQDKILFMINNISTDNIEAKAKECTKAIKEQYYPWFAQYMVMKRASIEPNFHDLYLIFLDKVNSKSLNREIVKATYENCKVLLRSDLIKSSSEERSLLKNLGSWLGKFTIGRNEALLAKEIDLKALIIEAYEKGLMIAVIPFTSKILESCQGSLAYKPPNVWTMAILALLVEIYNLPNLKMNLKFDIEVLFKNLTVDMKDVKPTLLLKDRVRIVEGNPDFSNKDICVSQASVNAEVNSAVIPATNQVESQADINNTSRPASHPNVLAQLLRMVPIYESHIRINAKLHNMSSLLQIHRFTKEALDKSIKDLVLPITRGSVAVACRTTKELVLKDNAMESDDGVISRAAHLMVGTLAGRLALVSCKEPFGVALSYHLRNLLQTLNMNVEQTEQIVRLITNDNIDLGCAVIEHVASQKAVELIDSEIGPLFAVIRKRREAAGTAYCGAGTYDQGPFAHVPEALRPKPGKLSVAQKRVYNDFVRNVWLNQFNESSSVVPAGPPGLGGNSVTSSMSHLYGSRSSQLNSNLYPTSEVVPGFRAARQLDLIQEASDCASPQLGISSNTVGPNDGAIHSAVEITSMVPSFASTATSPDIHTVETSTVSKDIGAVRQPSTIIPGAEQTGSASEPFLTSGDALGKYQLLAQKLKAPTADDVRESEILVSHMFSEWCCTCKLPTTNDTTYGHYISQLQQSGLLNGDDITDHFFHILTELSVAGCLAHENVTMPPSLPMQLSQELQHSSFGEIDAYAKLVVLVLKYFPMDQGYCKIDLLMKILSVTVRVIYKDAEEKKIFFNPKPYYRLFINWLLDLASADPVLDGSNFQELISFASAFHALQPLKVPGFSFSWLELVSHRSFMPKLMSSSPPKGWPHFQCLLVDLFKFMEPYLRNAELRDPVKFFYRGTLRVLLVLLHDFPEFLCDYHFSFCDVIPPSCTQLRNVILSAFPRNMRIPDPCTPNLKIDLLAEISQPPHILSDMDGALIAKQIKADIDEYMKKKPEGFPFLNELNQKLLLPESEANLAGTRYNIPLINSLVLYVGMEAIRQLQNKSTPTQQMVHNAPLDIFLASEAMNIFQSLVINLDTEGRYLFLNAVANQLRYPNNHTHYFSFVLLILFVEAPQEIIQEQITRVLLERLIAHRPHPWGLIITFLELIKNPRYNFWNRSFIRCAPEIEKLFESVARSCGGRGPKAVDDEMVAGGIPGSNH